MDVPATRQVHTILVGWGRCKIAPARKKGPPRNALNGPQTLGGELVPEIEESMWVDSLRECAARSDLRPDSPLSFSGINCLPLTLATDRAGIPQVRETTGGSM